MIPKHLCLKTQTTQEPNSPGALELLRSLHLQPTRPGQGPGSFWFQEEDGGVNDSWLGREMLLGQIGNRKHEDLLYSTHRSPKARPFVS